MTTIKDIMDYFETFAPLEAQMDFDNSGLLIGDKEIGVSKVLLALDITNEVINEAESLGCELIISHHPVIFNPIKHLSVGSPVYQLASKGISALCMHTNLDLGVDFGVNIALANAVGVKNPKPAEVGECLFVGELEEEITIDTFAENVMLALECDGLRYTNIKQTVRKIAVSSGAGGSNVADAVAVGADVLVTGEIRHHEINLANDLGINIIDAGHFKSEDVVINPLINKLSCKFPEISFTKSKAYSDKIRFIKD